MAITSVRYSSRRKHPVARSIVQALSDTAGAFTRAQERHRQELAFTKSKKDAQKLALIQTFAQMKMLKPGGEKGKKNVIDTDFGNFTVTNQGMDWAGKTAAERYKQLASRNGTIPKTDIAIGYEASNFAMKDPNYLRLAEMASYSEGEEKQKMDAMALEAFNTARSAYIRDQVAIREKYFPGYQDSSSSVNNKSKEYFKKNNKGFVKKGNKGDGFYVNYGGETDFISKEELARLSPEDRKQLMITDQNGLEVDTDTLEPKGATHPFSPVTKIAASILGARFLNRTLSGFFQGMKGTLPTVGNQYVAPFVAKGAKIAGKTLLGSRFAGYMGGQAMRNSLPILKGAAKWASKGIEPVVIGATVVDLAKGYPMIQEKLNPEFYKNTLTPLFIDPFNYVTNPEYRREYRRNPDQYLQQHPNLWNQ